MTGLRPIAELMFSDFFAVTWDMVVNQIAKTRYMTDGQVSLPLVLRTANGGGPPVRRPAQPEHRELGDGHPRPQGRRAVDAGRHGRPDGRRHPRPRPGHRLRAQGAVRDEGRGPRRRASSTRSARRRIVRAGTDATIVALAAMVPQGGRGRRAAGRRARHRRRGHRPALARPARHRSRSSPRSRRRAGCSRSRRTRGCAAGAPRSPRSSPTRASTASMRRSCGSPRRTSRCRRRPRSRTSRCRRSSGSSRRSSGAWTTPREATPRDRRVARPGHRPDGLGDGRAPGARRASTVVALQPDAGPGDRAGRADRRARRRPRRPRPPRPADVVISMVADDAAVDAVCRGPDGVAAGAPAGSVAVDMSTVLPDTIRRSRPPAASRGRGHPRRARCRAASASPRPAS